MRRVVSEPQVHVVEKEDEAELETGYRGEPARTVVQLRRPTLAPAPEHSLVVSVFVLAAAATLLATGGAMAWFTYDAAASFGLVKLGVYLLALLMVVLGGGLGWLAVWDRVATARRRREREDQRPRQVVLVRVDADGIHAPPRSEDQGAWTGDLPTADIRRVFAERGGAYHRVRVELEDGAEVTVLDGVESRMEAEDLVEVVQRRLARNPRRP